MTTKLLRTIERDDEAKRQAAWAERSSGKRTQRNPRWACDTLARTGQITADQHKAAHRYASMIERCHLSSAGSLERVDGGAGDIHARLWDAAVCLSAARQARVFVLRAPSAIRTRMAVLDRLFAFPLPTMAQMQLAPSGAKYPYDFAVRRIAGVLDLLAIHFDDRDRGLRPLAK